MKKQTKIAAVLSAAAFMMMVSGLPVYAASYGWVTEGDAKVYYDEDGYLTTDAWRKRGEDWFYLGEDGQIVKSAKIDEYYVDEEGKMVTSAWVELKNEEDPDSPETPDTFWYYFEKDGKSAVSKWVKFDSKWYYFDESGHMATGKTEIDGATYYLGTEKDGFMRTGWIRLEENSHAPGASESWYYFNSDGKMVTTQYDKKIDGSYYTFIDGQMQTGWINVAEAGFVSSSTPSNEAATTDNSATDTVSLNDFRYYDPENGGRRASGWYTIEGAPGISEEEEPFSFFFKNGTAYFAEKDLAIFTINSERYCFNERGEMQTGLQSLKQADGSFASYYFGDDGVMRTGKQTIYNDDLEENQIWYFQTKGSLKGQGYHGERDNQVYVNGLLKKADPELRYEPVSIGEKRYLVNTSGTIQKATSSSSSASRPELGKGFKDIKDSNDTAWTVDTSGIIQ